MHKTTPTDFPETTIGLDLGDRRTHACRLNRAGEITKRFSFATSRSGLERALGEEPPCRVVLEVGTHSPWISRWLGEQGFEVFVANPREVQSITQSNRKNDAADAEQLARLGRADPRLLRPIAHRGEEVQRDRAQLAIRRQLVSTRASLAVQARGLVKALGERLPPAKPEALPRKARAAGQGDLLPGLSTLFDVIDHLNTQIRELDAEVARCAAERHPETAVLRQVPGVGPITSLSFVLALEDPRRFQTSRRVGSYLGLQPRQRDSGESRPQLSISKAGDPELRSLLVECAQWILARGPDSDLRRFGERLAQRGGRAAKKKAVVAVARKLAVLLHRLWMTGEAYDPFYASRSTEVCAA
jgi:transposase